MTTKQRIQLNTECLQIVLTNRTGKYTSKEIETLKQWNGWGSIKAVLFGDDRTQGWESASTADKQLLPDMEKMYEVLQGNLTGREYKEGLSSMKASILTQFFTPPTLVSTFYEVLNQYHTVSNLYDPCAGSGTFIIEAVGKLEKLQAVCAYEKEIVTGKVLDAIVQSLPIPVLVNVKPFEESSKEEDGQYDLVCSNVPFGAFKVYDPACKDANYSGKVHNYFVWKGLQKVKESGIMAIVITSAFLDTVSNKSIREYLFMNSDFISLVVLPDNLFKEVAGTEAPSHFLVVRKNTGKTEMSEEEKLLCVSEMHIACGVTFALNKYCQKMCGDIVIGNVQVGKNQYGKPHREVKWEGDINDIVGPFRDILVRDLDIRYKKEPTLVETFQELGKIMGAELLTVTEETAPWDESDGKDNQEPIDDWNKLPCPPGGCWDPTPDPLPLKLSDIPASVKEIIPIHQQRAIVGSLEHWDILERIKTVVDSMPGPYGQEGVDADDKIVYLHYFYGPCDWYIVEKDNCPEQYQMYCYANLGDDMCAEWGYVGMPELTDSKVELDFFWTPRKFSQIHEKVALVETVASTQESTSVKKGPSKRDIAVKEAFQEIKELYKKLEIEEQNQ